MRSKISEVFGRPTLHMDIKNLIEKLNPKIIGMRNYYGLKNAKEQLRKIDWYIVMKFTMWYNSKRQIKKRCTDFEKVRGIIYEQGLQKLVV